MAELGKERQRTNKGSMQPTFAFAASDSAHAVHAHNGTPPYRGAMVVPMSRNRRSRETVLMKSQMLSAEPLAVASASRASRTLVCILLSKAAYLRHKHNLLWGAFE